MNDAHTKFEWAEIIEEIETLPEAALAALAEQLERLADQSAVGVPFSDPAAFTTARACCAR